MTTPLSLPMPIDRFIEVVHRGDTDAFLAFFAPTGVVNDSGRRFVGHDAIRRWSDREFIGAKGKMTVKGVKQRGSEITVTADWVSDFYTGPATFVFRLSGAHIQELIISA